MQQTLHNIEKTIISLLIMDKLKFNDYKLEYFMFTDKDYVSYINYINKNINSYTNIKDLNQNFLSQNVTFTKKILNYNEIDNILNLFKEITLIEILYKETIERILKSKFQNQNMNVNNNLLNGIENILNEVNELLKSLKRKEIKENYINSYKKYLGDLVISEKNSYNGINITGISSGLYNYDIITRGLKPAEYIILAARPSMGKTSLSLDLTASAIKDGKNVIYFSVEMPTPQMIARLLPKLNDRLTLNHTLYADNYELMQDEIDKTLNILLNSNFEIYDFKEDGVVTPSLLDSKCKEYIEQKGQIDLVVLDYVQLLKSNEKTLDENQSMSYISRDLASFMKKYNAPWIILSQLNRDLEKRDDKRPILSDLRNSGALEQDADIILFLYKESVYLERELKNKIAKKPDDRASAEALIALTNLKEEPAELNIAKNRNGARGIVNLTFIKNKASFYDKASPQNFDSPNEEELF